ncbi:hypothetical protein BHE74_00050591 [Ensete ventricosum]|nr:hypothetical protein BHE74_00050591 [Ensete ventricosum]
MMRWDLVGSSLGDSPKESGNSLGMRREIAGKKIGGLAARLPEYEGSSIWGSITGPPIPQNPGDSQQVAAGKSIVSGSWTACTIDYRRRLATDYG